MKTSKTIFDATIINHGSIFLLEPWTEAAHDWINEHIGNDAQWFGQALAIEPRYAPAIIAGMQDDGLTVD